MLQSIPYGTLAQVLSPEMIATIDGEVERRVEEMREKVLNALLEGAPVEEAAAHAPVAEPVKRSPGRRRKNGARTAKVPTAEVAADVLTLIKRARSKGLRAEHIKIDWFTKNQIQRALRHLCSTKQVTWTGEKRATTYRAA